MRIVARIVAVIAAVIGYFVVFEVAVLTWLLFTETGTSEGGTNGTFLELEARSLPGWVMFVWWVGLGVIVWLVGFRLPWWWRRRGS